MKRILLTLSLIAIGLSSIANATQATGLREDFGVVANGGELDKTDSRSQRKERRRAEKEQWLRDMEAFKSASDAEMAIIDSIGYAKADAALKDLRFVLESDAVTFKNGMRIFVNSGTTFISVADGEAVVQVSPSVMNSGWNGLGGVTYKGRVSDVTKRVDKRGNVNLSMNVVGAVINARIDIYMANGSDRAQATVSPTFNSGRIRLDGRLVPYNMSSVIEGRYL